VRILSDEELISIDLTTKLHNTYIRSATKNYTHFEITTSRHKEYLIVAFGCGLKIFCAHNAAPLSFTRIIKFRSMVEDDENSHLELIMPHNHRTNKAERFIQTARTYIIATLATADPNFSMATSKQTLEQTEITVNLVRSAPGVKNINTWEANLTTGYASGGT
jgi:N-acetyl-beta-hexosaminidase